MTQSIDVEKCQCCGVYTTYRVKFEGLMMCDKCSAFGLYEPAKHNSLKLLNLDKSQKISLKC